jgi:hypothetical protein
MHHLSRRQAGPDVPLPLRTHVSHAMHRPVVHPGHPEVLPELQQGCRGYEAAGHHHGRRRPTRWCARRAACLQLQRCRYQASCGEEQSAQGATEGAGSPIWCTVYQYRGSETAAGCARRAPTQSRRQGNGLRSGWLLQGADPRSETK